MAFKRIRPEDIAAKGVQSAPDILAGTPSQNKEIFDKLIAQVVAGCFNDLAATLEGAGGAGSVGTKLGKTLAAALLSDDVEALRLNGDGVIEVRKTGGEGWVATGSSGHLILDQNGTALPQRSRMQFANCVVEDNGTVTVVRGVQGDQGVQGDKGDTGPVGAVGAKGDTGLAIIPEVDQDTGLMRFRAGASGAVPSPVYVRGPQGAQGVQGLQGKQGIQGDQGLQGVQGVQGIQGERGETGEAGPQGLRGLQGTPGDVGPRGPEGAQGVRGTQGIQGEQGQVGGIGQQGPKGVAGDKGDKGDTGAQGETGESGQRGDQGIQGQRGEQGVQGVAGEQGPRGLQGQKGDRGLDGRSFEIEDVYPTLAQLKAAMPSGAPGAYQVSANLELYIWSEADVAWESIGALQGPQGPQGEQGVQGAMGPQGETGPQGEVGAQGVQGMVGPKGNQGEKGDKGDTGAKGETGATGSAGPKGDQGVQGVQGSVGPKGDTGAKGETGAVGPQGVMGPKGATGETGGQGIQGVQGVQGPQGAQGTPTTVNGKRGASITLTAADVGAAAESHGHTAAQVGADPAGSAAAVQTNLTAHTNNKSNPHGVTVGQIGAATAGHGHAQGDISGLATALAATKAKQVSVSLSSTWSGTGPYTKVVSVAGMTAAQCGDIGLAITATAAQREAARAASISVTGQAAGSLTLTADGDKPTVTIPAVVTLLN